ncbi:MAG: Hsp20/alpha crystallin family protein [Alphaproteobacteria bacterium]
MAEKSKNVPVASESKAAEPVPEGRHPFESLRREVDRLFEDFGSGGWRFPRSFFDIEPFRRTGAGLGAAPAVDVVEKDDGYEVNAELPGMAEKDIEVKLSNGSLTIRGEKKEESEQKDKNFYLKERRYGSFERSFRVPEGVDADKIAARFDKGVLTVMLPKKPEARKPEKKIEVKAG